jgi:hypothetical protein
MKLPNSAKDFEELMKGIKWNRFIPPIVSVLQPVIIGGLWLAFARFDKKADATSKFIAIAETIPTIDLNLPRPVVLASLYHSIDEALDVLTEVIEWIKDLEVPTAEDIIKEAKDTILDPVAEGVDDFLPDDPVFKKALADCIMNAKKNLPYGSYYLVGISWISSCMFQKGFKVSAKWLRKELGF